MSAGAITRTKAGATATLAFALLGAAAPASLAQQLPGGLNLFWDHCYSAGGTITKSFACDANFGPPLVLDASVVVPAAMVKFAAAEIAVDFWVSSSPLPPWWQTDAEQCRANALSASFDPINLADSGCPNIWNDTPTLSVQAVEQGLRAPSMVRLVATASVAQGSELELPADGTERVVARIFISRRSSTGAGACAGCSDLACLDFARARLLQPYEPSEQVLWNSSITKRVWLNTGPEYFLCDVPALNRTWGAIKAMYR